TSVHDLLGTQVREDRRRDVGACLAVRLEEGAVHGRELWLADGRFRPSVGEGVPERVVDERAGIEHTTGRVHVDRHPWFEQSPGNGEGEAGETPASFGDDLAGDGVIFRDPDDVRSKAGDPDPREVRRVEDADDMTDR